MKNIFKIMTTVILSLIIIADLWMIFSKLVLEEDLPDFFGVTNAMVLSGSMEPTFLAGDMLIYFEKNEYEINDVVIFKSDNIFITHRLVGLENGYFLTKGDANNTEDLEPLDPSDIKGEMIFKIPSIGHIINFLSTPLGLLLLILVGIAVFEVPKFFEKKKK